MIRQFVAAEPDASASQSGSGDEEERYDDESSLYEDAKILADAADDPGDHELRDPCLECARDYSEIEDFEQLELFRMSLEPEKISDWYKDPGKMAGNKYFALHSGYWAEVRQEKMVEAEYTGEHLKLLVVTDYAWSENFEYDTGFSMNDYTTMIENFGPHDGFMVKQLFDNILSGSGQSWGEASWEVCIYRPSLHKIHLKGN